MMSFRQPREPQRSTIIGKVIDVNRASSEGHGLLTSTGVFLKRPAPAAFAKKVHLLWVGVGTVEPERMRAGLHRLHDSLTEAKIQHVFYESPGTDHE